MFITRFDSVRACVWPTPEKENRDSLSNATSSSTPTRGDAIRFRLVSVLWPFRKCLLLNQTPRVRLAYFKKKSRVLSDAFSSSAPAQGGATPTRLFEACLLKKCLLFDLTPRVRLVCSCNCSLTSLQTTVTRSVYTSRTIEGDLKYQDGEIN